MIENSTSGLTLLDPDHEVVVTREERHQPALRAYAPRADGRARRVAVELVPAPGSHRIEVRLDGQRVGELTALMSQRYGPLVEDVMRRGGRPACVALVRNGRRGVEVELRLPVVAAATAGPAPRARRRRTPYLIGAGVATLLIAVGAGLGHDDATTTVTAAGRTAPVTTTAPATTPLVATPVVTPAPTTRPVPSSTPAAPVVAAVAPAVTAPRTTAAPKPPPAPRPTPRAVAPKPPAAAKAKPASACDRNYSGCVPVASDVDCAGGSGNGPAYVTGPVRVVGSDIYGLDADKDGIGCE